MKQLKIKKPCSADWSKMTGTEKKRFCASCELEVEDFTDKSVEDIIFYLENKEGRTCGRLKKSQLNPIRKIAAAVMIGGMLAGSCAADVEGNHLNVDEISLAQEISSKRGYISFRVKGMVSLGNGEKAEGAKITVKPRNGNSNYKIIETKEDGIFEYGEKIKMSEFDSYEFMISYEGYDSYSVSLIDVNTELNLKVTINEIEIERADVERFDIFKSTFLESEELIMGDMIMTHEPQFEESPFGIPARKQTPEFKRKI